MYECLLFTNVSSLPYKLFCHLDMLLFMCAVRQLLMCAAIFFVVVDWLTGWLDGWWNDHDHGVMHMCSLYIYIYIHYISASALIILALHHQLFLSSLCIYIYIYVYIYLLLFFYSWWVPYTTSVNRSTHIHSHYHHCCWANLQQPRVSVLKFEW